MRIALPFVTFFSVLCGYFVLRPVRDEIGVHVVVRLHVDHVGARAQRREEALS